MKTEEDEAFDELARKQGAWGGGFKAKQAMAADKYSDIVSDGGLDPRNKMDAQPAQESANYLRAVLNACGPDAGMSLDQKGWAKLHAAIKAVLTQPAQDVDYWIREATAARQAEMALRRELEAQPAQEPVHEALKLALITLEGWDNHDKWVWPETALEQAKRNTKEAITAIKEALAQPPLPVQEPDCQATGVCVRSGLYATPQRQWIWLSDADIAEVVDTTCQYTGSYEEYLIKKAERKSRSMNNG